MLSKRREVRLPSYETYRQAARAKKYAREHVSFLPILPRELRDEIWRLALAPLCTRSKHPYDLDKRSTHDRFKAYLRLRLVNRQVGNEVEELFAQEIAPQILFYCIHVPELYALRQKIRSHPILKKVARFHIRTPVPVPGHLMEWELEEEDDLVSDDVMLLMRAQSGYKKKWDKYVPFYLEYPNTGWIDTDDDYDMVQQFEIDEVKLLARGFKINKDLPRSRCCTSKKGRNKRSCKTYQEVVYPALKNKLQIKCFAWDDGWGESLSESQAGCTIMEGRIMDVSFDKYDEEEGRRHVAREDEPLGSEFDDYLDSDGELKYDDDSDGWFPRSSRREWDYPGAPKGP